MIIGYFARTFNKNHKSLSTKTHIVHDDKILCGYKPHKSMQFQWCASVNSLEYLECEKLQSKENLKIGEKNDRYM